MDTLSSCYFCGTALDEPLATYGVGDTEPAPVTLCQGCHHKLDTVFEAAGADQAHLSTAPIDTETIATAADSVDSESDPDDHTAPESSSDDPTAETDTPDAETDEEETDTSAVVTIIDATSGDSADTDEDEQEAQSGGNETETDTNEDSDSADTATTDDSVTTDANDILVDPESDDALDTGFGTEPDESGIGEETEMEADVPDELETGGAEEASQSDDEATDDETADDGATDDDHGDLAARTTISALEYNKVMRLLQNREFPVDREEIEAVATNAYDLRQSECAEVIDLAVDRGLIDEREGQLHRPAE